ncbi:hypothetical protein Tco_0464249 [Tanacetum coccineum]
MSTIAIEQLITQRVTDALLAYEANQNSGNGNGNRNDNGNHDSGSGDRKTLHITRGCTLWDAMEKFDEDDDKTLMSEE